MFLIGADESANREERRVGEPRAFDFEPKDHVDLGMALGILDLERAARCERAFRHSQRRGARLSRALINFMLDVHTREHGYTEPCRPSSSIGFALRTAQLPKFEADLLNLKTNVSLSHPDRRSSRHELPPR